MEIDCEFVRSLECKIDFTRELNLYCGGKHLVEEHLRVKAESVGSSQSLAGPGAASLGAATGTDVVAWAG